MLLRSIDFETSGEPTETDRHAVCEVGWSDVTDAVADPTTGLIRWEFSGPEAMLVDPGRPMTSEARAVHHISDADVIGAPDVTAGFRLLMTGPPDFFVSHNADFEREFFGGGAVPWICTYKVALRLWPEAPSHSLQVLRYELGLPIDQAAGLPAHRAGPDAYVAAALMARILEEDRASLDDMVRWSKGPALLPRCPIGEHRGKPWADVPTGFLRWMLDKDSMDRNLKANAKHELKRRGAL